MGLKKYFRQFIVNIFYFLMSNFSPAMRRNIGLWMDKNRNFIIIRKILTWYSELRPIDVYLLSFPKCGRIWLRLMIGYVLRSHYDLDHPEITQMILQLEPLSTLNIAAPKFRISHDDNPHWKKSEELDKSKLQYSKAKVFF
jgi:hypothetical protein